MNIIKDGNVKNMLQYAKFNCPVCGCQFEYGDVHSDDFMYECEIHHDHLESTCPCCNTPVRNYFKDAEVYPIARVIFYEQLKKKQEENLDTINKAKEQFFSNHKERMSKLQEVSDNLVEFLQRSNDIDKQIEENAKALDELLKD